MNMPLVLLNRRRRGNVFTPSALFALAEPGVWYDPSDVANLAWRRNLLTFTEQFDNAAWTKTNSSITANAVSAPDGTTTADKLVENTANSTHTASQAFTTSASTSYTFTVYAKADTRSHLDLSALTGFTTNPIVRFTLSGSGASSVRQGSPTPTHSIQSVGDGWYRCQINVTTVAGGSSTFQVALAVDASSSNFYTGDGTSGLFLWGAQLELGSVATDYQRITDVNTEVIERFPTATLYQDTAGTTPVTTPGQTVALALDKSKGLVLGPELVTNGDFSSGSTGWTVGAGWTISGGQASVVGTTTLTQPIAGAPKWIRVQFDIVAISGSIAANYNQTNGLHNSQSPIYNTTGTKTAYIVINPSATSGLMQIFFQTFSAGQTATIDNISVRELPGFHATQATAASRPTYGIVPRTGRRNLLTYSENLTDAIWQVSAVTKPTATRIQETATTGVHWVAQTNSLAGTFTFQTELKAAERSFAYVQLGSSGATTGCRAMVDLSAGTILSYTIVGGAGFTAVSSAITSVGDGWYRVVITASHATANNLNPYIGIALDSSTVSYAGNASNGILARNSQLETGSSATAYQRVGSAFDVTEAGVPSLSYLSFDGVDDFLVTPTITPGIDKAQVFAGVRKLSDAAAGMLLESSSNAGANNGALYVVTGPDPNPANRYSSSTRGSAGVTLSNAATTNSGNAPDQAVLSTTHDIAGDLTTIRRNGVAGTSATVDLGTGNFLAYPFYIGRRNGISAPANMNLFSLITRFGTNLDAATITNTETWVNGKTGAYT